jgi:acetoacetate decarboxylase
MTKGFSRPFSPNGTASLAPALPLNFAGDLTLVHFDADPAALAAYLPAPLDPTGEGDAFLWTSRLNCHRPDQDPAAINPARTFYNVCVIGIPALMDGKPTMFSAFQWADRDWLLGLSWFLGACSKLAVIEETGRHPLYASLGSSATGGIGSSFTRTVSRNGSRVATVKVDMERSVALSALDFYFGRLPLTCMRHIPDVGVPPGRPVLHDLTHMIMSNVSFGEVREGAGELAFGDADNEDLLPLQPRKVHRAYIASMAFLLEGAKTIHNYLEDQAGHG